MSLRTLRWAVLAPVALLLILSFAAAPARAGQAPPPKQPPGKAAPKTGSPAEPPEAKAPTTQGVLSAYAARVAENNKKLREIVSRHRPLAWVFALVLFVIGAAFAFWGWALVRTFFVPICMAAGLGTGALCGWSGAMQSGHAPLAFRVGVVAALCLMVFYGVLGWKIKPVGAFLMALSTFMMAGALAAEKGRPGGGIFTVAIGVMFAFLTLRWPRGILTACTASAGAQLLMSAVYVASLAYPKGQFPQGTEWVQSSPLRLAVVFGFLFLLGLNIQFTIGPGGLTEDEQAKWRTGIRGRQR